MPVRSSLGEELSHVVDEVRSRLHAGCICSHDVLFRPLYRVYG